MIMPERDLSLTIERLRPMLNDPDLQKKIEDAAEKNGPPQGMSINSGEDESTLMSMVKDKTDLKALKGNRGMPQIATGSNTMLAQVVGVILGSPEFQRK